MFVCLYVWLYGCMYVCMHAFLCLSLSIIGPNRYVCVIGGHRRCSLFGRSQKVFTFRTICYVPIVVGIRGSPTLIVQTVSKRQGQTMRVNEFT